MSKSGLMCLMLAVLLATACGTAPERFYEGPAGDGRLVFEPGVGITRRDAVRSGDEQALFQAVEAAFAARNWDECIRLSRELTENFPEGSRVVDAILLRVHANIEAGRVGEDSGFSPAIPLHQWMMLYLAPDYDERIQRVAASGEDNREFLLELRSLTVQGFIDRLVPDARSLNRSRRLEAARQDVRNLLTYYVPALELREYRQRIAEAARDVCWLLYAAASFNRVIETGNDLLAVNPPPSVKGDTLFIEAQAMRRNGAHFLAAEMFGFLFSGAGLRDTDTRWRPYALMWQIHQTLEISKGWRYDLATYEEALELLGEYELYRLENPNIPDGLHDQFLELLNFIYDVMVQRQLDAADTYSRLRQRGARDYYLARASEWESMREAKIAALREMR